MCVTCLPVVAVSCSPPVSLRHTQSVIFQLFGEGGGFPYQVQTYVSFPSSDHPTEHHRRVSHPPSAEETHPYLQRQEVIVQQQVCVEFMNLQPTSRVCWSFLGLNITHTHSDHHDSLYALLPPPSSPSALCSPAVCGFRVCRGSAGVQPYRYLNVARSD